MIESLISATIPEASRLPIHVCLSLHQKHGEHFSVRESGAAAWADQELREERTSSPGGGTEGMEVR